MDLTKRQKEIFDFIGTYAGKYGYPPTVREIGKAVGLTSSWGEGAAIGSRAALAMIRSTTSTGSTLCSARKVTTFFLALVRSMEVLVKIGSLPPPARLS